MEGEARFLHVPQTIDTLEHDRQLLMIFDKDVDVPAVRQFISE